MNSAVTTSAILTLPSALYIDARLYAVERTTPASSPTIAPDAQPS